MAADSTRLITDTILITLVIEEDGSAIDADSTPTAEVRVHNQVVQEVPASSVSKTGTGSYRFTLTPSEPGLHVVEWTWVRAGQTYTDSFRVEVQSNPTGSVEDNSEPSSIDTSPAIGSGNVCTVTATFYKADGSAFEGVFVRFTPLRSVDSFLSSQAIVQETTASSNENGELSLQLVRGVKGTLSVSGLGIVRTVRVPDVATIPLRDLVDLGDDVLAVQTTEFTVLPRRS